MSKPIAYIGVDPGAKGSFCLLVPEQKAVHFWGTAISPHLIMEHLESTESAFDVRIIMIEDVHSLYGMSAKSNFSFGYNTGTVNALSEASGIGVDRVPPKKWQKQVGVRQKGKAIKKEVAEICDRLYPRAEILGPRGGLLDGRSDSLLIAHYAYLNYNQVR